MLRISLKERVNKVRFNENKKSRKIILQIIEIAEISGEYDVNRRLGEFNTHRA